jgi:ferritin
MGAFSKWKRKDLEYHIMQLMNELYDSHRKYMDGETFSFVDILNDLEGEDAHLLKDLAREIWREEDYSSAEEWEDEKRLLGL